MKGIGVDEARNLGGELPVTLPAKQTQHAAKGAGSEALQLLEQAIVLLDREKLHLAAAYADMARAALLQAVRN